MQDGLDIAVLDKKATELSLDKGDKEINVPFYTAIVVKTSIVKGRDAKENYDPLEDEERPLKL